MSRTYYLQFGSGLAASFTGLSPTFLIFNANGLTAITPPGISEMPSGSGLYRFLYGATIPIVFTADGATSSLSSNVRYVSGVLDPSDLADEALGMGATLSGLGLTLSGLGATVLANGSTISGIASTLTAMSTFMGTTAGGFGSTSTDPSTIFGYLKRVQENLEGNATYTKSTGIWQIFSRGSSTLLAQKALVNSSSTATKS